MKVSQFNLVFVCPPLSCSALRDSEVQISKDMMFPHYQGGDKHMHTNIFRSFAFIGQIYKFACG